jgi:hypothetical protein
MCHNQMPLLKLVTEIESVMKSKRNGHIVFVNLWYSLFLHRNALQVFNTIIFWWKDMANDGDQLGDFVFQQIQTGIWTSVKRVSNL